MGGAPSPHLTRPIASPPPPLRGGGAVLDSSLCGRPAAMEDLSNRGQPKRRPSSQRWPSSSDTRRRDGPDRRLEGGGGGGGGDDGTFDAQEGVRWRGAGAASRSGGYAVRPDAGRDAASQARRVPQEGGAEMMAAALSGGVPERPRVDVYDVRAVMAADSAFGAEYAALLSQGVTGRCACDEAGAACCASPSHALRGPPARADGRQSGGVRSDVRVSEGSLRGGAAARSGRGWTQPADAAAFPRFDGVFKPLLHPPPLGESSHTLLLRPPSPPHDVEDFALVDWRWARAWGYYDSTTRRWDEAKGGLRGYVDERRRRAMERLVKRRGGKRVREGGGGESEGGGWK